MNSSLLTHEAMIRFTVFFGVLLLVASWELLSPKRVLQHKKWVRWIANLGVSTISSLLIRFGLATSAVAFAVLCQENSWGLFNILAFSPAIEAILAVILLDMVIYFQHVMFHFVPLLWRLHRMHHADTDFDVTTGIRFHPIEIILSFGIKLVFVYVLGPSPEAVLIFEILLNATAMFNHGNIQIPSVVDRYLRWFIVTPDMHRVHHSVYENETNSNFGFNLPWWDRIFGTYIHQTKDDQQTMRIGLKYFREPKLLQLHWLLVQPFMKTPKN